MKQVFPSLITRLRPYLIVSSLLPLIIGRIHAQNEFIEPNGWESQIDLDPCGQETEFIYSSPSEIRLCDLFPNFEPSPGCTITAGTITNYGPNEYIGSKNFLVLGQWTINTNNSLIFENCNFKMAPGALITLNCINNLTTTFSLCNFFGCDKMWRGITVKHTFTIPHSPIQLREFNFLNCHIEDATAALQFLEPSDLVLFNITGNTFNNNYFGLQVLSTSSPIPPGTITPLIAMKLDFHSNVISTTDNLRPFYSIHVPARWPLAEAGVFFKGINVLYNIGRPGVGNMFTRTWNGVSSEVSKLDIRNNQFSTLWQNGVFADACDLTITNNDFIGEQTLPNGDPVLNLMFNGIYAKGCDSKIGENQFTKRIRFGIWCDKNIQGQTIEISYNVFKDAIDMIWPGNKPCGIRLDRSAAATSPNILSHNVIIGNNFEITARDYTAINVVGTNTATDEILIKLNSPINLSNTNNTPNFMKGIRVATENGDNYKVTENRVNMAGYNEPNVNYGIEFSTSMSTNFIIHTNYVIGEETPVINDPEKPQSMQCAIHLENDAGAKEIVCNNEVDMSYNGLHFWNGEAEVTDNMIRNHTRGMAIEPSMLGFQDARGNQWLGQYIKFAASYNDGSNPVAHTRFWVSQSDQLPFLPPNNLINPDPSLVLDAEQKWFRYLPILDEQHCSIPPISQSLNEFELMIATGNYSGLSAVQIWDAKRSLFLKALEEPNLLQATPILQSFQNNLQNTSISAFAQVDAAIRNITRISAAAQQSRDYFNQSIKQNTSQLQALLASINYDLTLAGSAQLQDLNSLATQITMDLASREALDIAQRQQIISLLGVTTALNEALQPNNTHEQARKDLNRLKIHRADNTPATQTDYQATLTLAGQLPSLVGLAARDAWFLLGECDQHVFDTQRESQSEGRSDSQLITPTGDGIVSMTVFPNPSYGKFQVLLNTPVNGLLKLIDVTGNLVDCIELDHQQKTATINAANVTSGMYFLMLRSNDGKISETVRIIIR